MFFCKKLGVKDAAIFILHYIYIYTYCDWRHSFINLEYYCIPICDWKIDVFESLRALPFLDFVELALSEDVIIRFTLWL